MIEYWLSIGCQTHLLMLLRHRNFPRYFETMLCCNYASITSTYTCEAEAYTIVYLKPTLLSTWNIHYCLPGACTDVYLVPALLSTCSMHYCLPRCCTTVLYALVSGCRVHCCSVSPKLHPVKLVNITALDSRQIPQRPGIGPTQHPGYTPSCPHRDPRQRSITVGHN